ncbi:PQQ-dependent sugar dehydrogenase [Microvirga arabica]|uniref:PQQ-dependent sugar dehydrogenase n=1 Tax=Microvirga arabica TaxID=1128671 RepID=A0ABV6YAS0_9HYPH
MVVVTPGDGPDAATNIVPSVAADLIVSGLSSPVYLTTPSDNPRQLFIVEKGGRVKIHDAGTAQTLATPFLDVSSEVVTSGEQGLLGLAFSPDYATSRKFYVYLSNTAGDTEIREYQASASNPLIADPATMRPITTIDYPSQTTNHRGGWIGFGPDGYLYAATGDGAVRANAQSLSQLGKILRLDVSADAFPTDASRNYAAPNDNPASIAGISGSAVGSGIFAAGLRNPWRASFDRLTGDLYIGDVGERSFEEINLGRAGANYGWSLTEGPFDPAVFPNYTNPIHAYGRSSGQAVTGGYVYRGAEAAFQGKYFFSDFVANGIRTLETTGGSWAFTDLTGEATVGGGPIELVPSWGEDAAGNLFIVDFGGKVFRVDLRSNSDPEAPDAQALVDDSYYLALYPDVKAAGVDPDAHYAAFGWQEGRNPNAYFNTNAYLSANQDVDAANINPLEHYHQNGWKEGRDASVSFDTTLYLLNNADVRNAGIDPLEHFLAYGRAEGRQAYTAVGQGVQGTFDAEYYLLANPDVGLADVDAAFHFANYGWKEGRDPNAFFDSSAYLQAYTDVAAAGVNPLEHYNTFGWKEGRDPSGAFDTSSYLQAYADVAAAGVNPLQHYLQFGIYEGRSAFGDSVIG